MESQEEIRTHSISIENEDLIRTLVDHLELIRDRMLQLVNQFQNEIDLVHPAYRDSAENLLHYLALRQEDIRPIQDQLGALGLSSLGRTEAHVLSSLNSVFNILLRCSKRSERQWSSESNLSFADGKSLLQQHTKEMLGPVPLGRSVRIMVTMPSEAAENYQLVKQLLMHGMDCMRINCAHDNALSWARMISNLRRAEKYLGKKCLVLMDLGGPKLRTETLLPGPAIVKIHVRHDQFGNTKQAARIWLTPQETPEMAPVDAAAALPIPGIWLKQIHMGDIIKFEDIRGKRRSMEIVAEVKRSRLAEISKTAYVGNSTRFRIAHQKPGRSPENVTPEGLPQTEIPILLMAGDTLILTHGQDPGNQAIFDQKGHVISPARMSISIPEVFSQVRKGESIWFDDGKIGGVIQSVSDSEICVKITQAEEGGSKLRSDKGINLPDTDLHLPALAQKDIEDLDFVAKNADIVGLSFAQDPLDIIELQHQLLKRKKPNLGLIAKIETRRGFEQLPRLILAGMRCYPFGIMIARGDLAVECGYERLAEIQEEMLWICEAAHIPAVWATQVLESLSKKGIPSRAEITDAAMSVRAECVMLNKGPHVIKAVEFLDDILHRMQGHQEKKTPLLRRLQLSNI